MRYTYVLIVMLMDEAWKLRFKLDDLLFKRERRVGRAEVLRLCMMRGIFEGGAESCLGDDRSTLVPVRM